MTMMLCVSVLFMNNVGMENNMNTMGMQTRSVAGIFPLHGVNTYQESGVMFGIHVMTEHLGPKAMARPTSQDHKQADRTKKMFISFKRNRICSVS
jgi:hypothetical protein